MLSLPLAKPAKPGPPRPQRPQRPQRRPNYTSQTVPAASNSSAGRVTAAAPAKPAPSNPTAPAKPESKFLLVPVKTQGKGPGSRPHYDTVKVPEASVTDVPRPNYEIKSKGRTGPKGQIATAFIFYRGEQFHALGDADGNFYGGRLVAGNFVTKFRFLADPDEQAALKAAKLAAEAKALKEREEAKAKDRAAAQAKATAKAKQKADELARKAKLAAAAKSAAAKAANGGKKPAAKSKKK